MTMNLSKKVSKRAGLIVSLIVLVLLVASCRNETQNRIRRNIQDFTSSRMYITVYSYDGKEIFNGIVDGKITRSSSKLGDGNEQAEGSYIYWYDEKGQFNQTNLPYFVSIYDRNGIEE